MTNIILYSYPGACSRVTMCALEEAGIAYKTSWIDITTMGQYSADYLTQNRKGKVPALGVDGQTLTENPAILTFLHQTNPNARLLPQNGNPLTDAQGLSDLVWCSGMLHPMVRQIRAPQKWTTGEVEGVRADGMAKLAKECDYIDARLGAAEWWYGADWSIVDTYLYWVTSTAEKSGFLVANYPAITAHSKRVRARPSFQRTLSHEIASIKGAGIALDPDSL